MFPNDEQTTTAATGGTGGTGGTGPVEVEVVARSAMESVGARPRAQKPHVSSQGPGNEDQIPCNQKPCRPRTPSENQDDVNAGLKGRPVLYTGVVWIGIVRRFLIPRSCGSCTSFNESRPGDPPKTVAHVQEVDPGLHEPPLRYNKKKPLPAPAAPLITEEANAANAATGDDPKAGLLRRPRDEEEGPPSPLRALVVQVHEMSSTAAAQAREISEDLGTILREGTDTTAEVIETVRSENGKGFRLTAISASGLVGYLAGLKRGPIARMVFTATGATAMATICYPEDTKIYNKTALSAIRQWIVLGLSLVHSGPQKPLDSGDTRAVYSTNLIQNEEKINISNTKESENKPPFNTESIISNLKQNLESLGNTLEDLKARITDAAQKAIPNDSVEENNTNSASHPPTDSAAESSLDSLTQLKPDRFENVSLKNNDTTRDIVSIPYSPSLPAPPKMKSSQNKLNVPPLKSNDSNTTSHSGSEDPLTQRKKSQVDLKKKRSRDYFLLSQEEIDQRTSNLEDDEDDDEMPQKNNYEDFADKTFIIPTGGLEEKLEGRRERIKRTGFKNGEKPLNQKLTVYYRDMPEVEKTSREKGYNDAYSNRGK